MGSRTPEGDRLDVPATLIDAYEAEHCSMVPPDPAEAIKFCISKPGLERSSLTSLQPELLESFQRQEKTARLAQKGTKAVAFIERTSALVLGIDDDGIYGDRCARPDDAADGVEQQRLAEPVPL